MDVLVTGSEGLVGNAVCRALSARGHLAIGFDRTTSGDVLDLKSLCESAGACDAIIHCAALLGHPEQTSSQTMEVNVQGTWNVLLSALASDIEKVVFLSSVDVLGVFKGERAPDFLPLDESHACYPATTYGVSKYLAEEMCRLFASAHNKSIICLRPPGVWESPATYEWIANERRKRPSFEWNPFWEYGAFIDVRDLAEACVCSLDATVKGFHCVFVSSDDITTSGRTSFELSTHLHATVEWRGDSKFDEDPYRTLLSNETAKQSLNWSPSRRWTDFANR